VFIIASTSSAVPIPAALAFPHWPRLEHDRPDAAGRVNLKALAKAITRLLAALTEAGNRRLADIVTASQASLRLASLNPFASLVPLMRCHDRLAAKLYTPFLPVGSAARGAFRDSA
jgi:hypothetical protein